MFTCPYTDGDATPSAVTPASPPHSTTATAPRVVVFDSDTEDSLGSAPPCSPPQVPPSRTAVPATRAFSKRAARCAAAVLGRSDTSPSAAQREHCRAQLGSLGGAYGALARGAPFTIWVRYHELCARAIHETEVFFAGRLADRVADPRITRASGALAAGWKGSLSASALRDSPAASIGCRTPLPTSASPDRRGSRGTSDAVGGGSSSGATRSEQCALSLLLMDDAASPHSLPGTVCTLAAHHASPYHTFDAHGHAALPSWAYGDGDSTHSCPSPAAHHGESPCAAPPRRKRARDCHAARALDFDERSPSPPAPHRAPAPQSLSATVLAQHNRRVHEHLLRRQSLFHSY
ncbi:hypothetical protein NESM_000203900 [Novymonas esmeraldas]|uniref:Uncharacterized protein n=1 Tax=Novymonas esmeraldas TaxID=1808958 RepID=A0AAW0F5W2_9TRYP